MTYRRSLLSRQPNSYHRGNRKDKREDNLVSHSLLLFGYSGNNQVTSSPGWDRHRTTRPGPRCVPPFFLFHYPLMKQRAKSRSLAWWLVQSIIRQCTCEFYLMIGLLLGLQQLSTISPLRIAHCWWGGCLNLYLYFSNSNSSVTMTFFTPHTPQKTRKLFVQEVHHHPLSDQERISKRFRYPSTLFENHKRHKNKTRNRVKEMSIGSWRMVRNVISKTLSSDQCEELRQR